MSLATATRPSATAAASPRVTTIRPQPGFQTRTLTCSADILINGGGAGPGKTFALLLESLRHYQNPLFGATIFRRTSPEITKQGGLWDESWALFPYLKAVPNKNDLAWEFPSGARVQFAHCQYEKDKYSYDGSQICLLGFDQLEHFTEGVFWYLWARNRSTCGVRPYIRATCNPIPSDDVTGGWLHKLIQWWIDPDTGKIIPERDGVLRWFLRVGDEDEIIWGDSKTELLARYPSTDPNHILSFTFIEGKLEENVILIQKDPAYKAKLLALPKVERERLLHRNWNVRPTAGNVFNRAWFEIVEASPAKATRVRYWDKAGTEDGGARSAGVLMAYDDHARQYYVEDCVAGQWSSYERERVIKQTAMLDGHDVETWVEQEPGSGGKESAENTIRNLAGFIIRADRVSGNKFLRAGPMSAQAEANNIKLVEGPWNAAYIDELHAFDPTSRYKDRVDASSGAFNKLAEKYLGLHMSGGGATEPLTTVTHGTQQVDSAILAQLQQNGMVWPNGG